MKALPVPLLTIMTSPAGLQPPPKDDEPAEVLALRRARLSIIRTHNELAKLEIRDENLTAAEGHYVAAIAKCKDAYGDLSPESGEG